MPELDPKWAAIDKRIARLRAGLDDEDIVLAPFLARKALEAAEAGLEVASAAGDKGAIALTEADVRLKAMKLRRALRNFKNHKQARRT